MAILGSLLSRCEISRLYKIVHFAERRVTAAKSGTFHGSHFLEPVSPWLFARKRKRKQKKSLTAMFVFLKKRILYKALSWWLEFWGWGGGQNVRGKLKGVYCCEDPPCPLLTRKGGTNPLEALEKENKTRSPHHHHKDKRKKRKTNRKKTPSLVVSCFLPPCSSHAQKYAVVHDVCEERKIIKPQWFPPLSFPPNPRSPAIDVAVIRKTKPHNTTVRNMAGGRGMA